MIDKTGNGVAPTWRVTLVTCGASLSLQRHVLLGPEHTGGGGSGNPMASKTRVKRGELNLNSVGRISISIVQLLLHSMQQRKDLAHRSALEAFPSAAACIIFPTGVHEAGCIIKADDLDAGRRDTDPSVHAKTAHLGQTVTESGGMYESFGNGAPEGHESTAGRPAIEPLGGFLNLD